MIVRLNHERKYRFPAVKIDIRKKLVMHASFSGHTFDREFLNAE